MDNLQLNKEQSELIIQSLLSTWASREMNKIDGLNIKEEEITSILSTIKVVKDYRNTIDV